MEREEKKKQILKMTSWLFVKHVWPDFIEGRHHKDVAKKI